MDHDYDPLFVLDHENQSYIWKTISIGVLLCVWKVWIFMQEQ